MVKIELEEQDLQIVVDCLAQAPFKTVSGLIRRITEQANKQIDEQAAKRKEEYEEEVYKRLQAQRRKRGKSVPKISQAIGDHSERKQGGSK